MASGTDVTENWGRPISANCGQDLTGLVDSSKCSECGKPLVEVLVRETSKTQRFRRYSSKAKLFGMPALSIARGIGPDGRPGHARGWIAIGDRATGVVAFGGSARGIVAFGGSSVGVFAVGGMSVGLFVSFGGMAISPLGLAFGGMAIGAIAVGGMAIGFAAVSGSSVAYYSWGPPGGSWAAYRVMVRGGPGDQPAIDFFESISWLVGSPSGRLSMLRPMVWAVSIYVSVATALAAPGVLRWSRESDDPAEGS